MKVDQGDPGGFWESLGCPAQLIFPTGETSGQGHRQRMECLKIYTRGQKKLSRPRAYRKEADMLVMEKLN